jgi:transposase InsO family protein
MTLTAINQLWRAHITYIRLRDKFVFLAVILDAYSRRIIGWTLDRSMEDSLTLTALGMALARRRARLGASFRPRLALHQPGLHGLAQEQWHRDQHVAPRQPVGQRGLRVVHEDAQIRRSATQRTRDFVGLSLKNARPAKRLERILVPGW